MKYFSDLSLKRYRELNPPVESEEEVIIPTMTLGPNINNNSEEENNDMIDVDALVASFKSGTLNDDSSPTTTDNKSAPTSNTEENTETKEELNKKKSA